MKKTLLLIPGIAAMIALWGILTITASQSGGAHPLYLAGKQFLFFLIGTAIMLTAGGIPFRKHADWRFGYAVPVLLLLLFLPLGGVRIHGMRGWYDLGGIFLQPSELGKGVFLLLLASAGMRGKTVLLWSAVWILPILLQPDFGTAAVYGLTLLIFWFAMGGKWKVLAGLLTAAAGAGLVFLHTNAYAWKRLTAFFRPEADPEGGGWHIRQFQLAIAHGHWTGVKLGQSFWSSEYLPFAYNDSAYAAMAETLGFCGAVAALVLYAVLYVLLIRRAMREDLDETARRYLAGAAILLAVQTLLHAGVNTGLLPPTGLTLPLASYGGSSMIGTMFMLGIAVSAAKTERQKFLAPFPIHG